VVCGAIFFFGLMSDYIYFRLLNMEHQEILKLILLWPYFLLALLLALWYMTLRHFFRRRQTEITLSHVNSGYLIITMILLIRGLITTFMDLRNAVPDWLMMRSVEIIYSSKKIVAEVFHSLIPNWQLFWMADALTAGKEIPVSYVLYGFSYIALFAIVFSCLAYVLFTNREVGKQV
jgi:hypothetical protein